MLGSKIDWTSVVMGTLFPTQVPVNLLPAGTQVPVYWTVHLGPSRYQKYPQIPVWLNLRLLTLLIRKLISDSVGKCTKAPLE